MVKIMSKNHGDIYGILQILSLMFITCDILYLIYIISD